MIEQRIIEEIKYRISSERVLLDEPMSKHTTFRIGGNADVFVSISNDVELSELIAYLKSENIPYYIVGNGSNLLVSDKGYQGVIIEIGSHYNDIHVRGNQIIARAGAFLSAVSHIALENELTGLEFASGIPGTVGGAIIMNAGAYGGEMKQIASQIKVILPDGTITVLTNEDMKFEYRNSRAKKEGFIILQVTYQLSKGDREVIDGIMRDLNMKRRDKQPLEYPSAGSTFKRPPNNFAGKLIADAGLKGFSIGGAQVSEKHAGFLVNKCNSSAQDMYNLIWEVRKKVAENSGIELEPEVIFLGDFE